MHWRDILKTFGESLFMRRKSIGRRQIIFVDNCGSQNMTTGLFQSLQEMHIEFRYFSPIQLTSHTLVTHFDPIYRTHCKTHIRRAQCEADLINTYILKWFLPIQKSSSLRQLLYVLHPIVYERIGRNGTPSIIIPKTS